jgi:mevalonate kinase
MEHAAQSGGKVIITGEHSVVYGYPALVAGISLTTQVTLGHQAGTEKYYPSPLLLQALRLFQQRYPQARGIQIHSVVSQIPTGCGLGSSAAVVHALFKALAQAIGVSLSMSEMIELIQTSEQFAHGNPSGVDATAVVTGGLLRFQKQTDQLHHQTIHSQLPSQPLYLINSGQPTETTKEMVALVADQVTRDSKKKVILESIGSVSASIIEQVEQGTMPWELWQENQRLLDILGVVGERANRLINQVVEAGGTAKITGAGGKQTGSGMILSRHPDTEKLEAMCQTNNWEYYQIFIS